MPAKEFEVLGIQLVRLGKDRLRGIVDAACVISVMGDVWWEAYLEVAKGLGLGEIIEFWSGDVGAFMLFEAFMLPVAVAGNTVFARACFVESNKLSFLVGRDFLDDIGASTTWAGKGAADSWVQVPCTRLH